MTEIKKLKKILEAEDRKEKEQSPYLNRQLLSKIIKRMEKKYEKEGLSTPDYAAREKKAEKLKVITGSPKELLLSKKPIVRFLISIYMLSSPISYYLLTFLEKILGKSLEKDLKASGMMYSQKQYLALTMSLVFILWVSFLIPLTALTLLFHFSLFYLLLSAILIPLLAFSIAFLLPSTRASKIANEIDKELPFALRHMSIQIRAGVGIYNSMESIAVSDYGYLSKGFKFVLSNIQKGMPTEEALESWAYMTRSEALQRVISHIVRALRTGGNLSDIMLSISEDISFERRMKISDFAEKLNLMALFLMMVAIVVPVMVGILTAIASMPSLSSYVNVFSIFSLTFLQLLYFLISPSLILLFLYFIKISDPGA
ncbi:hypothetical protein DRN74_01635 [Candidatus Micrarchaeota archaeon]|nr:MAG: hypothetical protein DRN74_01635 [Candidatus Micrarchaeota archaeon]